MKSIHSRTKRVSHTQAYTHTYIYTEIYDFFFMRKEKDCWRKCFHCWKLVLYPNLLPVAFDAIMWQELQNLKTNLAIFNRQIEHLHLQLPYKLWCAAVQAADTTLTLLSGTNAIVQVKWLLLFFNPTSFCTYFVKKRILLFSIHLKLLMFKFLLLI